MFKFHGGNAKDYAAEYNNRFPNALIQPWEKTAAVMHAQNKVKGDFYILVSSALKKNGVPDVRLRTEDDGTQVMNFKVNDSELVKSAIERLKLSFPNDMRSTFDRGTPANYSRYQVGADGLALDAGKAIAATPATHSIGLSGNAAALFVSQSNAFMAATGHSAPDTGPRGR